MGISGANVLPVPAAAGQRTDTDRDWFGVAGSSVGLVLCAGTLALYSFGVFVRPLTAAFGWSRTELFAALAFFQYGLAFSSPMWGVLTDRYGPRRVILFSVVALSVLVGSLAVLTANLWHLYAVFLLIPLLGGGASPLGYSAALVVKFDRHLGLALGLALMGVGVGAAILPPLAQAMVGAFGWRVAYAGLGVLTLLVTFPAAVIATRGMSSPEHRRVGRTPIAAMVRTRAYALIAVVFVLLGIVSVGIIAHLVPMLTERGFSPGEAARVAGLSGLTVVIGRGVLGWLLDRVHAPYVLAAVGVVTGLVPLLLMYGHGTASLFLAAVMLGFGLGAEVDFISFLVRRYFERAAFGQLYGIAFGLFLLGSGTGPLIMGTSFDRAGGYGPGLIMFAALAAVVVVLALAMPRYDRVSAAPLPLSNGG